MNFTTFVQEIGRISRYPHTETFIEKVASEKVASEEVASERFMVKMIGSGPKRKKLMAGEEAEGSAQVNWPLNFESSDTANIGDLAQVCFSRGKQVAVFRACKQGDVSSQHEFIGFSSHVKRFDLTADASGWLPVVRGKGKLERGGEGFVTSNWMGTVDALDDWKDNSRLIIWDCANHNDISNDDSMKSFFQITNVSKEGEKFTMKITWVPHHKSKSDQPPEYVKNGSKRIEDWKFMVVKDITALEDMVSKCEHGGSLHELRYKMPCALAPVAMVQSIRTAINKSDADVERSHEIWECLQFQKVSRTGKKDYGTLDDYMNLRNSRRKETPSSLHNYQDWIAKEKSCDCSCEARKAADDPSKPSKVHHTRRFLLFAECQIGKTGAYMHFLKLLRDECSNQPRMLVVDPEWALPRMVTSRILWALPYWRDLAQGGKADQFKAGWNVRRGKYHIKMRYERCARAFSFLVFVHWTVV